MDKAFPTAQAYAAERARFPARQVVDLQALQREATEAYRNEVVLDCNDACLRMAVFEGQYRWHHHPATDELFLVVAGQLHIEFDDGAELVLHPSQCAVVPAGTVHRTRGHHGDGAAAGHRHCQACEGRPPGTARRGHRHVSGPGVAHRPASEPAASFANGGVQAARKEA